ncbi:PD-(D/E)XK nuclease family protein [Zhouia sp. PK063]|uniref:PD-(D/E)XK nuclease family protein n=1 Tax=Zhouia sp. PK063 TaxID=3373602 RepID=UPI0037A275DB
MITSFLEEVVTTIVAKETTLENLVFVLPSKRAGVFLKNALVKKIDQTIFAPEILSIETFVEQLSNLKSASNVQLVFEFYEVYKQLTPENQQEDFYTFSRWATVMLQDFNEIDRYLINTKDFFSYLSSVKEINHWSLSPDKTEMQEQYLSFWKRLDAYYSAFSNTLAEKGLGYQGLIYREALENVELYIQNTSKKHYFIGFNALNTAESNLIQEFLQSHNAEIFWDIDTEFLEDYDHDAGLFMRKYKQDWNYFQQHPFQYVSHHFSSAKHIELIGVPKNVGQAKFVGKLLNDKLAKGDIQHTAVVLGNESLLNPLLNSLPKAIEKANITSGFPLFNTPIATFFNSYFSCLEHQDDDKWYYQYVLSLLSHPITRTFLDEADVSYTAKLIAQIQEQNIVFVSLTHLKEQTPESIHIKLDKLFVNTLDNSNKIVQNCVDIIVYLKDIYANSEQENGLYLEYLFRFYELFNQILVFNTNYNAITTTKALKGIFSELLSAESVDFQGEPLEGLQIMGMLESRNLDFETVIITSVNEGILPSGKSNNSFIPFDMKVAFNLPTYKEKDAVYTYHFYRLLQRAKNVYVLYNTEPDVLEGGEKSRFLLQLELYKKPMHELKNYIASPKLVGKPKTPTEIHKNEALLQKLKEVATKGFSPTSLSNYVRNPIDFYYQSVLGIRNEEEVEENIAANTLGTIIHNTLEDFYKPLEGEFLTKNHLLAMKENSNTTIAKHFEKEYKGGDYSRGKNYISYQVALRYITNFLKLEEERLNEGKQIKILHIESNLRTQIPMAQFNFPVYIRGKVDRVEEENGIINIIDYKTGRVMQNDVEITSWNDLTADYKYSKAFQILSYVYMMQQGKPITKTTQGGIISFKNLKGKVLQFAFKEGYGRGAKKFHEINNETIQHYQEALQNLILEIFDTTKPLTEKEV